MGLRDSGQSAPTVDICIQFILYWFLIYSVFSYGVGRCRAVSGQFQGAFRAVESQGSLLSIYHPADGIAIEFYDFIHGAVPEQFRSSSGAILEQFRRSFEATQAQFRNNCKLLCTNSLGTFLQFQSNFRAVGAQFPIDLK